MINRLPHGPEFGDCHKFRLHQAASGIFRIFQRPIEHCPVFLGNLREDFFLLGLVHILNEIERVVRIELLDGGRDHIIGQRLHEFITHDLIKLRQGLHIKIPAQRGNKLDAVVLLEMFDEISEVSRMQLARDGANLLGVFGRERCLNARQIIRRN